MKLEFLLIVSGTHYLETGYQEQVQMKINITNNNSLVQT